MTYPKVFRRENRLLKGVFWYLLFEKPGEAVHAIDSDGFVSACIWTEEEISFSSCKEVTNEPEIQEALRCLNTHETQAL